MTELTKRFRDCGRNFDIKLLVVRSSRPVVVKHIKETLNERSFQTVITHILHGGAVINVDADRDDTVMRMI